MSERDIIFLFEICNAVWFHDGNPKSPHAELSSGLCTNGYFNCSEVLKYPQHCHDLAYQLVQKLKQKGVKRADWVIGAADGATTLSYEVADIMGAIHGFTQRDPKRPKQRIWNRLQIPAGMTVLQIEDAVSTASTLLKDRLAIEKGNKAEVKFLSVVGTVVLRPPKLLDTYKGIQIVALIKREIWVKDRKNCPLCKAGSKRYRPKKHWQELTGEK